MTIRQLTLTFLSPENEVPSLQVTYVLPYLHSDYACSAFDCLPSAVRSAITSEAALERALPPLPFSSTCSHRKSWRALVRARARARARARVRATARVRARVRVTAAGRPRLPRGPA